MHLRKNRTRSPPPPQVRFAVLRKFMGGTSHVVLKHKLCDLAFTRTLRGAPPCAFTPRDPAEFVYWYTRAEGTPLEVNSVQEAGGACAARGEGAGASTGVEIAPREIALARAEAARALAATGRECAMDETTLAFFFSALRQGISSRSSCSCVSMGPLSSSRQDRLAQRHVCSALRRKRGRVPRARGRC